VHALAGYTSAVVLALIAALMVIESLRRLLRPEPIAFSEALPVAIVGLVVNLVCVKLLHTDEHHGADHDGDPAHDHHAHDHHAHGHHGHDHNLRAAYFHVLADALTSVLAILALLGGRFLGWTFLAATMGIVGGVVIARWSYGLCREAAKQLLDVVPSEEIAERIPRRIE
ncbi:cation diffusion facilitator family transporter, partial [Aeromonas sp. EERV15]|uniref:cation diffusion facilitator family transporter n=1 Tax=Aeromonas sp. EERV15 TaxID=1833892 RepID=UPI000B0DF973